MPLLGFNPGVPSNTPGIVTACDNWIPYEAGMEAAPSAFTVAATVCPAAATGAFTGTKLDGSRRIFVGTDTKLYEMSGADWVDVSQSASAYVSGSVWSFCQFGDATLAANYGNTIQASSTSSFSAVVGAPKAKIIESVVTGSGGFVFAFNTNDANYGTSPDRWWCSALNDHTSWTVSAATQATSARLVGGGGGAIVAAKKFGADSIVAYKPHALYHFRYVGGSAVWVPQEIPIVGAAGLRCVADLGFAHFIVAQDGFWLYDGARPTQIGTAEVRQWFASNVAVSSLSLVEVYYEQDRNRVWVFFPQGGSTLNRALVYHVGTGQWGLSTQTIETAFAYYEPSVTYATWSGTYADEDSTYEAAEAGSRSIGVFNGSHKLVTLTGIPGVSWFQTADVGDANKASRCTQVFVEYATRPASASCRMYTSYGLGGTELVATAQPAYDEIGSSSTPGRFPVRTHGRYHRAEFNFTGSCRVTNYVVPITAAGSR